MPEILDIERDCFGRNAWTEEDFMCALTKRNCIGLCAELSERVVGYVIYELRKDRIDIVNLAVAPEFQRTGIGSDIVAKLRFKLDAQRREEISLLIRDGNLPGQLFFRSAGFRAVGILHYAFCGPDGDEDGYRMVWRKLAAVTVTIRRENERLRAELSKEAT
jgi:ribosomal-protein-alanine N-acetyltransferase